MNKKLLALYGLKWNPFAPDVPVDALRVTPRIDGSPGAIMAIETVPHRCAPGPAAADR